MRVVLAIVSVAAGVSLGVSVVIMNSSVTDTLRSFGTQLAGPAPLRIIGATSSAGIEADTLTAVQHTQGVANAVPMVQAVTYAAGGAQATKPTLIVALGIDCSVQALVGRFGCTTANLANLTSTGGALVSRSLAQRLGQNAVIRTDQGDVPIRPQYTLSALDSFDSGRVAIFPLATAQRVFDRQNSYDAIYVTPVRGTDLTALRLRLSRVVGKWNGVLLTSDPPPGITVVTQAILPLFVLLSLFALAVGAVLIFNIMSLAMEERRRELAVIAAVGGTAGTVRTGAATEGALLGLTGGLLGVVGGYVLAGPLTNSVSNFTRPFVGVNIHLHMSAGAIVAGALLGTATGALAAALPTRKAMRMDVAAELSLREPSAESAPRPQARLGLIFLAVSLLGLAVCWLVQRNGAIEPWQAAVAPLAAILAAVAFILASGAFAVLIAMGLLHLSSNAGGPVRLGLANLARQGKRAGVMTIAIAASVATAFTIQSTHSAAEAAIAKSIEVGHPQEVYVSTLGPNDTASVEAKPDPQLATELARIPGVARVDESYFLLSGHTSSDLMGVSAHTHPWLNAPLVMGNKSSSYFESGHVLVGVSLARGHHLRPGSTLTLDTPTGIRPVTVGGVWQDAALNGNDVTMPVWLFQHLFGNQPAQNLGLLPTPGVSPNQLAARVEAAHVQSGIIVETPAELARTITSSVSQQLQPFDAIQRALFLVAFVAVLSTLLLVGVQRRREMGLLAAVGMEPLQLARMTIAEGASAGVIGVGLSVVGSIIIAICFSFVLPIVIGYKDPLVLSFSSLAIWGPVSIVLVTAASLLPAWRNSRLAVIASLQYE